LPLFLFVRGERATPAYSAQNARVQSNAVTQLRLTPLRTPISNGALAADQLPDRLKILGWGDNPSVKGTVRLTEISTHALPQRQAALGFDRIALDWEHNTVAGTPEYERTQEPRSVAAYGVPVVVPGDGLYLERLEWTPAGRTNALNYADLSPAVELDAQGNITFVHSVALCRNGAVEGLSFFTVSVATGKPLKHEIIAPMSDTTTTTPATLTLAILAGILGLAADAPEATVVDTLKQRLAPPAPVDLTPLTARLDKVEKAVPADVTSFSARLEKVERTLLDQASATTEVEKTRMIKLFSADGKVPKDADGQAYTAEALRALDLGTLRLLHANTPATVPLTARAAHATEGKATNPNLKGRSRLVAALEVQNATK
jgi:phage I-like protein